MSENLYVQFRRLVGGPPLQYGEVIAKDGDLCAVEMPGGGRQQAKGTATVGQKVYVRGGVIEGGAPDLPVDLIDV